MNAHTSKKPSLIPLKNKEDNMMLGIKEIGTYPTPTGEVNMFYENSKVVVIHYDACGEQQFRVVYDTLDEARIDTSDWYY